MLLISGNPFVQFKFGYDLNKQFGIKWIADYRDDWNTSELESNFGKVKQFVDKLVPNPKDDASQRVKNYAEDTRSALIGLWMAPTQNNVTNTKWAAYNAVAEYEDWAKPVRGGENKDVLRAERIVNGGSETLKQKAQLLLV